MKGTTLAKVLGSSSLGRTLLLSSAALIVFFFSSTMFIAWTNVSTTTRHGVIAIQDEMHGNLANVASNSLTLGNHEKISQALDAMMARPEIQEITLFDYAGNIFSTARKPAKSAVVALKTFELKITRTAQLASKTLMGGDNLVAERPVAMGRLVYTLNLDAIRKPALRVFKLDLVMCVTTTLIFSLLIVLILKAQNRPITLLVESIQGIESGDTTLLETPMEFCAELNRVWDAHVHAVKNNRAQAARIEMQNIELQERAARIETQNIELQERAESREIQMRVANSAIIRLDNANAEKDAFVKEIMEELRTKIEGLSSSLEFVDAYIDNVRTLTHKVQYSTKSDVMSYTTAIRSWLQQLDTTHNVARLCSAELQGTVKILHTTSKNLYEDVILNIQPIAFLTAFGDLMSSLKADAEAKSLRFFSRIAAENKAGEGVMLLDWERVALVIRALVSNAITYTDAGGSINVLCELAAQDHMTAVRISVDDTGAGIDDATQCRLRELFSTESTSSRKSRKSAVGLPGMSLDLSQRVAKHMGATVHLLRSQRGKGSHFCFEFEARLANPDSDRYLSKGDAAKTKLKVLLVNDVAIEQTVFRDICRRAGHTAHCVASIHEALQLVDDQKWDVLFTAHQFNKGPDGLEFLRIIRQRAIAHSIPPTPVVIIVRELCADIREQFLAQGSDEVLHYLDKPTVLREILAKLTARIVHERNV